eukprot:GHUV01032519.1.p2 GENE.GHUV01032519.1~~GHUV01032519.1.p2  ORF type:complete len:143 (-),score=14.84 GHUV01032519.1:609-1037(-)
MQLRLSCCCGACCCDVAVGKVASCVAVRHRAARTVSAAGVPAQPGFIATFTLAAGADAWSLLSTAVIDGLAASEAKLLSPFTRIHAWRPQRKLQLRLRSWHDECRHFGLYTARVPRPLSCYLSYLPDHNWGQSRFTCSVLHA